MNERLSLLIRVAMFVLCLLLTGALLAQQDEPIYPTYEGHTQNEDGTFSLVFGYYNSNAVEITVEPGAANGFAPGPVDRDQTTTFLPGRHRGVCVMVVPADFVGNLRWTIRHAGTSSSTTERGGLDPLYELEPINALQRVIRSLDLAAAPHHVCVDRAPVE